jgi:hypothetical protein
MKGLAGDFATMPLRDLVHHLGQRRASGTLQFVHQEGPGAGRQAVHKGVELQDGAVVSASSSEPREYLGQFLIHMGALGEEAFSRAYQLQNDAGVLLGGLLVRESLVPEEQVRVALALKFRETLLEAFRWEGGTFTFVPGTPQLPEGALAVSVDLLDVHAEGEFRETAWRAIRAVFPDGRQRLAPGPARPLAPPAPGSLDAHLLRMAREGLRIDDMVVALHATDFALYQRLYALYRQELVQPAGDGSAGGEDLEGEALVVEGLGEEEALGPPAGGAAASGVPPLPAGDAAAQLDALRRALVDPPRVPALRVPATDLKGLGLGPQELYLLSRVDGRRDLASIVRMSPLKEADALRHFYGLLERGLIGLSVGGAAAAGGAGAGGGPGEDPDFF